MAISLKRAQDVMRYAPEQDCVVTTSAPGTGKDATWYAAAARANAVPVSVYSATMEAVDARGLPFVVDANGEHKLVEWAAPNFLPLQMLADKYPKDREIWVNFTDWFQSPPSVLRATVRSVYGDGSERRIGDFPILERVRFFANGNREQDRAGVYRPETYVNDRITYIEAEPDVDEWVSGAINGFARPGADEQYAELRQRINMNVAKGTPDELIAYVKFTKSVYEFNSDARSFLSPRSIERLGRFIRAFDAAGINGESLQEVANGTIGEVAAMKYMAFHKLRGELPDINAILRGEDVKLPPKSEVLFILCTSLLRAAKKEHVPAIVKFINRLAETKGKNEMPVGVEVIIYMARECLHGAGKALVGIQAQRDFLKWMEANGKYLM